MRALIKPVNLRTALAGQPARVRLSALALAGLGLSAAGHAVIPESRAQDASAQPIPGRSASSGGFSQIYEPPSPSEAVDINAGQ